MKHSDKPLLKETMRKLQLLPGIEPHPQGLESTTLTTAPIPLSEVSLYLKTIYQVDLHLQDRYDTDVANLSVEQEGTQ